MKEAEYPDLPIDFTPERTSLAWRDPSNTPPIFVDSLLVRILYHCRRGLLQQQLWAWLNIICTALPALFIEAILDLLTHRNQSDEVTRRGILLCMGLLVASLAGAVTQLSCHIQGRRFCNRLRASLLTEVFAKAYRCSAFVSTSEEGNIDGAPPKTTDVQQVISSDVFNICEMKDYHGTCRLPMQVFAF